MKKDIKKIVKDDFNEHYKYKPNKEEIIIKNENTSEYDNKVFNLLSWRKLSITMITCMLIIISGLIILNIVSYSKEDKYYNCYMTDEFEEYIAKYGGSKSYTLIHKITIESKTQLYIVKTTLLESNEVTNNYLYLLKTKRIDDQITLISDNKEVMLTNNSFGKFSQNNDKLSFSIVINDQIYEYKLG